MRKILIAGVGNIFHGDDGFGCEVVRQLKRCSFPDSVTATDFGIRSYDLAYALADGYDAVILVDALPGNDQPGTVHVLEPDVDQLLESSAAAVDAYSMNPLTALQAAQNAGGIQSKLFVVGCEPSRLEEDEGSMVLSEPVYNAVPKAIEAIRELVDEINSEADRVAHEEQEPQEASRVPA
jgi:hydrogenase maturation protease